MVEFLAIKRTRRRPRTQEHEQEERRRNRDEAWELNEKILEESKDEKEGDRERRGKCGEGGVGGKEETETIGG